MRVDHIQRTIRVTDSSKSKNGSFLLLLLLADHVDFQVRVEHEEDIFSVDFSKSLKSEGRRLSQSGKDTVFTYFIIFFFIFAFSCLVDICLGAAICLLS